MSPQFFQILCRANQGKISLIRKDFKDFLSARYGHVMAEKWQNMLDFSISLDIDTYRRKIVEIFTKREVMYQLAFDFYDTNNDERISELDLYKVWQTYGKSTKPDVKALFGEVLCPDLMVMTHLTKWQYN